MAWVFIDVPEPEVPMALQAGAKLHWRHQKYFFDSRQQDPARFARWSRIPDPTEEGSREISSQAQPSNGGQSLLSLHEVAVLCGISSKFLRALVDESLFPKPLESSGRTSRGDKWSLDQINRWRQESGILDAIAGRQGSDRSRINFLPLADVAAEAGFETRRDAFKLLREAGVLIESEDESLHNAPMQEYLAKGWFGRLERYLPGKQQLIYQTVVVGTYRKEVTVLLRSLRTSTQAK